MTPNGSGDLCLFECGIEQELRKAGGSWLWLAHEEMLTGIKKKKTVAVVAVAANERKGLYSE